jgi:glycosyltransferase involved in cell wall biosynthesis
MDGGSEDQSVEIIRKYEPWLTYWVSEKDGGQSDALNKGFDKTTGPVLGWLNSDDFFYPSAMHALMSLSVEFPSAVAWVGASTEVDISGKKVLRTVTPRVGTKKQIHSWPREVHFHQASCFFSRDYYYESGEIDNRLCYVMDVDLWSRLADYGIFACTDKIISCFRLYKEIKTLRDEAMREAEYIYISINQDFHDDAKYRLLDFTRLYLYSCPYEEILRLFLIRSKRIILNILASLK